MKSRIFEIAILKISTVLYHVKKLFSVGPSDSSFLIYGVFLPYLSACKKLGTKLNEAIIYGQKTDADTLGRGQFGLKNFEEKILD